MKAHPDWEQKKRGPIAGPRLRIASDSCVYLDRRRRTTRATATPPSPRPHMMIVLGSGTCCTASNDELPSTWNWMLLDPVPPTGPPFTLPRSPANPAPAKLGVTPEAVLVAPVRNLAEGFAWLNGSTWLLLKSVKARPNGGRTVKKLVSTKVIVAFKSVAPLPTIVF